MTPYGLQHIDLRQIRSFLVLAEELNFRRAAERLNITQPPLTRQIKLLEEALGVALFRRNTHHVALTEAGQLAAREFGRAHEQCARAFRAVAACADKEAEGSGAAIAELRIGLPWWANLSALASVCASLAQERLIARHSTQVSNGPTCVAEIRKGRMDAAVVVLPLRCDDLRMQTIGELSMLAAIPATSPLARRRSIPLTALAAFPTFFMFARKGNPLMHDHLRARYVDLGFQPEQFAESNDAMATLSRVAAGQGTTLVPEILADQPYAGVALRALTAESRVALPIALIAHPKLDERIFQGLATHAQQLAARGRKTTPRAPPSVVGSARAAKPVRAVRM